MQLDIQAATRRAGGHTANEDRVLVGGELLTSDAEPTRSELSTPALLAVLDGMGGHPAGDVASDLAARTIARAGVPTDEAGAADLLRRAHERLGQAGEVDPERRGMGTTVALLAVAADGTGIVANVGDSPVLRLGADGATELSVSDRGLGSSITQSLGGGFDPAGIRPHVSRLRLAPGDRLLLATDGLTDVLDHDTVAALLRDPEEPAVPRLLDVVAQAGTPDDVSVVVVEVG